jgi:hypothetical protein
LVSDELLVCCAKGACDREVVLEVV